MLTGALMWRRIAAAIRRVGRARARRYIEGFAGLRRQRVDSVEIAVAELKRYPA